MGVMKDIKYFENIGELKIYLHKTGGYSKMSYDRMFKMSDRELIDYANKLALEYGIQMLCSVDHPDNHHVLIGFTEEEEEL